MSPNTLYMPPNTRVYPMYTQWYTLCTPYGTPYALLYTLWYTLCTAVHPVVHPVVYPACLPCTPRGIPSMPPMYTRGYERHPSWYTPVGMRGIPPGIHPWVHSLVYTPWVHSLVYTPGYTPLIPYAPRCVHGVGAAVGCLTTRLWAQPCE